MIIMDCPLCKGKAKKTGDFACLDGWLTGLYYCFGCGSMTRFPMPSDERIAAFYNGLGLKISRGAVLRRIKKCDKQSMDLEKHLTLLGINKNDPIMDLGAGIGGLIHCLRKRGYNNIRGIEPRETAVAWAKKHLSVDLIPGWIDSAHRHCNSPPKVLLLSHVLEHLSDPIGFLTYLKKNFKGSYLWIEVPDGRSESLERNGEIAWRLWGQHLWSYTPKGLAELLKVQNFEIAVIEGVTNYLLTEKLSQIELRLSLENVAISNLMINGTVPNKKQLLFGLKFYAYFLLKQFEKAFFVLNRHSLPDSNSSLSMMTKIS